MRDFQPDDPAPPFRQLAAIIRDAIADGEFRPGDRLPSSPALRKRYGLAPMTVQSAIRELRTEGLVASRQGIGVFVRTTPVRPSGTDRVGEVRRVLDRLCQLRARIDVLTALQAEHERGSAHYRHTAALLAAATDEQSLLIDGLSSFGA
ncbi:winged helix-turn-helix domain-containing protein [Amycolatopsis sp. NPDC004079]|uniref:GntR family transcriptional regulator n=1 Tax=Amycolatopsis sp. NPDC004079 TaxID=3154549 RepID=UPI0033B23D6A